MQSNVVYAFVLEIGYDARASLTRATVDQDVRVVGSVRRILSPWPTLMEETWRESCNLP